MEQGIESEQMKFEFTRQIDELHRNLAAQLAKLEKEHSEKVESIESVHQETMSQLQTSRDEIEIKHNFLCQGNYYYS